MSTARDAKRWLTTAEAAAYCGFRSHGGIQNAVARGELVPDAATPKGHRWKKASLRRDLREGTGVGALLGARSLAVMERYERERERRPRE